MADTWAGSFGIAWGVSFGQASGQVIVTAPAGSLSDDGGGGFGRQRHAQRYKKRDSELMGLMPIIIELLRRK